MKKFLGAVLLTAMLWLGAPVGAQVSVGIRVGPPPEPRVVAVTPVSPGAEYVWVGGYWYPVSGHYRWHRGYWTRPPYAGARWVGPHHDGERFFAGYWDGEHGRFEHSHRWDREHDRDHNRYPH